MHVFNSSKQENECVNSKKQKKKSHKRNFYSNSDIIVFEIKNMSFSSDSVKNPLRPCSAINAKQSLSWIGEAYANSGLSVWIVKTFNCEDFPSEWKRGERSESM